MLVFAISTSICALDNAKQNAALQSRKVLVFSPHPDDDIIGCGGSIAKLKKNGYDISIVYMISGRVKREHEAEKAERILGVSKLRFLRNADSALRYNQKNIVQIVNIIRQEQPGIVYLPHCGDAHRDHIATNKLVMDALGLAFRGIEKEYQGMSWKVDKILCYEVWTPLQGFLYYENISKFMELKLQALRQHASQLVDTKYDDAIEGLNRYRGAMSKNGKYCECFQVFKISEDGLVVQNQK